MASVDENLPFYGDLKKARLQDFENNSDKSRIFYSDSKSATKNPFDTPDNSVVE